MLNQMLRPIVRSVARNGTRTASSTAVKPKLATLNDVHQPCGSWKEHYDSRQKVFNAQLIGGLVAVISTITFIKVSGIIFFNYGPPEPEEK